jgi:hypothetical protein
VAGRGGAEKQSRGRGLPVRSVMPESKVEGGGHRQLWKGWPGHHSELDDIGGISGRQLGVGDGCSRPWGHWEEKLGKGATGKIGDARKQS